MRGGSHVVAQVLRTGGGVVTPFSFSLFLSLFEQLLMLMCVNNHGQCLAKLALSLCQSAGE